MHVYEHSTPASLNVDNDNYIVTRDGSVSTDIVPLNETIGDLRGQLGNVRMLQGARGRVYAIFENEAEEK